MLFRSDSAAQILIKELAPGSNVAMSFAQCAGGSPAFRGAPMQLVSHGGAMGAPQQVYMCSMPAMTAAMPAPQGQGMAVTMPTGAMPMMMMWPPARGYERAEGPEMAAR